MADVNRALAFYQSQLGMKYLFLSGDLVFFDRGEVRLLSQPEGAENAALHASTIYSKVPDMHQVS